MNTTRRGKVARLPKEIRDELNLRLMNGQTGKVVLEWLNGLERAKAMLAEQFNGQAVSEHNLSQWRRGGYQDWLMQQDAAEHVAGVMEEAEELKGQISDPMADRLGVWVVAQYCAVARDLRRCMAQGKGVDEKNWKRLRELCHDVVALRRGDNYGERRHLVEGQLELARERMWKKRSDDFWQWAEDPRVREAMEVKYMSEEERMRAIKGIFGMAQSGELEREEEESEEVQNLRMCRVFGYLDEQGRPTRRYVDGEFQPMSEKGEVRSASGKESPQAGEKGD